MTKEFNLDLLNRLTETKDREESIRIAMELFPNMTREEAAKVTDEALAGYQPGIESRKWRKARGKGTL